MLLHNIYMFIVRSEFPLAIKLRQFWDTCNFMNKRIFLYTCLKKIKIDKL